MAKSLCIILRKRDGIRRYSIYSRIKSQIQTIKSYGTDALRMALVTALGGQDIHLGEEKLEGMRNFTNKLWNAGRFIMMNIDEVLASINLGSSPLVK